MARQPHLCSMSKEACLDYCRSPAPPSSCSPAPNLYMFHYYPFCFYSDAEHAHALLRPCPDIYCPCFLGFPAIVSFVCRPDASEMLLSFGLFIPGWFTGATTSHSIFILTSCGPQVYGITCECQSSTARSIVLRGHTCMLLRFPSWCKTML